MFKSVYSLRNCSIPLRIITNSNSITVRSFSKTKNMTVNIEDLPTVDIDPSGIFKYILLKVYKNDQTSSDPLKILVRGYKRCNYHSDIYDEVQASLHPLDLEPFGGGRISHDPESKKIHIYGYSQGYGKADHEITAKLVKEAYPQYTVSISDEGY